MRDCLPERVDPRNQFLDVVDAGDEDLVFDRIGFGGCGATEWLEAVDYVVAGSLVSIVCSFVVKANIHEGITNPITG